MVSDEQLQVALDAFYGDSIARDVRKMRAALEAAAAAAWRPIEEAPKDGTPVLMAQMPDGKLMLWPRYCVALYQTIPGAGEVLFDWQYGGKPTHFRYFEPLPEPPK